MCDDVRAFRLCVPRFAWTTVACLLIGTAGGCGSVEPKEGLVPAYGTVKLDGEPLANAEVRFKHPQHSETIGRTDEDGYYEMAYTFNQEGAFQGENTVSFSTAIEETGPGSEETVPKPYLIGKSKLTVEVTDGGAPYDFDLSSNGN